MNKIKRQKNKRLRRQVIKLRAFIFLFSLVTVLSSGYILFLGMSVKSVVERKSAETHAAVLRAEIAQMEHEYLMRVSDITMDRATNIGLTKVAFKSFAERRVLVQAN